LRAWLSDRIEEHREENSCWSEEREDDDKEEDERNGDNAGDDDNDAEDADEEDGDDSHESAAPACRPFRVRRECDRDL